MRNPLTFFALIGTTGILSAADLPRAGAAADPCSLLTAAQVGAALGVAFADGKPLGSKSCAWAESGAKTGKRVLLTLVTLEAFTNGKGPLEGTEKPAVSGVGDEAYYKYFAAPRYEKIKLVDLEVKKGSTAFVMEVGGLPMDDAKAKAKTLAVAAVSKL